MGHARGHLCDPGLVLSSPLQPLEARRTAGASRLWDARLAGSAGDLPARTGYRGGPFSGQRHNWVWLRTGWWGILGLIGWAYLTVATLHASSGTATRVVDGRPGDPDPPPPRRANTAVSSPGWTTSPAGAALPVLKSLASGVDAVGEYIGLGMRSARSPRSRWPGACWARSSAATATFLIIADGFAGPSTFVVGLFLAGLMTDTFEGINKIAATPTWCLWCAALACALWIVLYQVIDVAGFRAWSIVVRPAGANPLIAYFLHPIVIGLVSLSGYWDRVLAYKGSHEPWVVVAGSLGMAFSLRPARALSLALACECTSDMVLVGGTMPGPCRPARNRELRPESDHGPGAGAVPRRRGSRYGGAPVVGEHSPRDAGS